MEEQAISQGQGHTRETAIELSDSDGSLASPVKVKQSTSSVVHVVSDETEFDDSDVPSEREETAAGDTGPLPVAVKVEEE